MGTGYEPPLTCWPLLGFELEVSAVGDGEGLPSAWWRRWPDRGPQGRPRSPGRSRASPCCVRGGSSRCVRPSGAARAAGAGSWGASWMPEAARISLMVRADPARLADVLAFEEAWWLLRRARESRIRWEEEPSATSFDGSHGRPGRRPGISTLREFLAVDLCRFVRGTTRARSDPVAGRWRRPRPRPPEWIRGNRTLLRTDRRPQPSRYSTGASHLSATRSRPAHALPTTRRPKSRTPNPKTSRSARSMSCRALVRVLTARQGAIPRAPSGRTAGAP